MPRVLAGALLALVWVVIASAGDASSGRAIDLNEPGALEALQGSNPAHYEKIRQILVGVLQQPDAGVARWMRATFDARDVRYVPIVLTSHPAKRRLSFSLDVTRYEAVVVLTNMRGDVVPAK